jgi:hypothetical protein
MRPTEMVVKRREAQHERRQHSAIGINSISVNRGTIRLNVPPHMLTCSNDDAIAEIPANKNYIYNNIILLNRTHHRRRITFVREHCGIKYPASVKSMLHVSPMAS